MSPSWCATCRMSVFVDRPPQGRHPPVATDRRGPRPSRDTSTVFIPLWPVNVRGGHGVELSLGRPSRAQRGGPGPLRQLPRCRSPLAPVMDRRRRRLSDATPSPAGRASITCGSHGPTQPAATPWADQQRGLLCSPLLGCIERTTRDAQIPIALMAPSRAISRGFLPWRLSDDGPGASRVVAMGRHPKPFTAADVLGPRSVGSASTSCRQRPPSTGDDAAADLRRHFRHDPEFAARGLDDGQWA